MNFHLVQPRVKYYGEIQNHIEKAQKLRTCSNNGVDELNAVLSNLALRIFFDAFYLPFYLLHLFSQAVDLLIKPGRDMLRLVTAADSPRSNSENFFDMCS